MRFYQVYKNRLQRYSNHYFPSDKGEKMCSIFSGSLLQNIQKIPSRSAEEVKCTQSHLASPKECFSPTGLVILIFRREGEGETLNAFCVGEVLREARGTEW